MQNFHGFGSYYPSTQNPVSFSSSNQLTFNFAVCYVHVKSTKEYRKSFNRITYPQKLKLVEKSHIIYDTQKFILKIIIKEDGSGIYLTSY